MIRPVAGVEAHARREIDKKWFRLNMDSCE